MSERDTFLMMIGIGLGVMLTGPATYLDPLDSSEWWSPLVAGGLIIVLAMVVHLRFSRRGGDRRD